MKRLLQYSFIFITLFCCIIWGQEPILASTDTSFIIGSTIYFVNGSPQTMDVAPYVKNGRTYLPVRYVANALGISDSNIIWDEVNQTVILMKGDKVVQVKIGSTTMFIDGVAVTMDVTPEITSNRTMLPLRFIAQSLSATVNWDAVTQTVRLVTDSEPQPDNNTQTNTSTNFEFINLTSLDLFGTNQGDFLKINHCIYQDSNGNYLPIELAGNDYNNGFVIENFGTSDCSYYVAYNLNSNYNRLTGLFGICDRRVRVKTKLIIYGDSNILYESPFMTKDDIPIPVDVDVTNVKILKFSFVGLGYNDPYWDMGFPAFVNPQLLTADSEPQPDNNTQTNTGSTNFEFIDLTSLDFFGTNQGDFLKINHCIYQDSNGNYLPIKLAGNDYNKGFVIENCGTSDYSYYVAYNLDSNYKRLTGLFGACDRRVGVKTKLIIYGDSNILYESPFVTKDDIPILVDVDVTDVKMLKFSFVGLGYNDPYWMMGFPAFVNPQLYY